MHKERAVNAFLGPNGLMQDSASRNASLLDFPARFLLAI
jgi:hypothetical protein